MKTIFGIECNGPDLDEAETLEALGAFHRASLHNQEILSRVLQRLMGEGYKLRDVDRYCCQWCGNSIPDMSFKDIVQMIRCYQEVIGPKAFSLIEQHTGVSRPLIYAWVSRTRTKKNFRSANYNYVIKVAQFVRAEIRKFSAEQKEQYHQLYPKAS